MHSIMLVLTANDLDEGYAAPSERMAFVMEVDPVRFPRSRSPPRIGRHRGCEVHIFVFVGRRAPKGRTIAWTVASVKVQPTRVVAQALIV